MVTCALFDQNIYGCIFIHYETQMLENSESDVRELNAQYYTWSCRKSWHERTPFTFMKWKMRQSMQKKNNYKDKKSYGSLFHQWIKKVSVTFHLAIVSLYTAVIKNTIQTHIC